MIIATNGDTKYELNPEMMTRHGLICGSTGTGKTTTLRLISEQLSNINTPCLISDIKGDLSGIANQFPVEFWDLKEETGHPIQTIISDLGPLLLARLLDVNKVQTGIITLGFKAAREMKPDNPMIGLGCFKILLKVLGDNAYAYTKEYGNITYTSIGAIQRSVLELEEQGVDQFFNKPVFDINDLFSKPDIINILNSNTIINQPKLYSTFLLWLMSELYEKLPEVGDLKQPKFVFFFDEAHLLFKDCPKVLLEKIEQIIKLIRSKGVGIFFITQNPLDIPKSILAQLGNRIQHSLRAFTPEDYTSIKKISKTFRINPKLDIEATLTSMKTGEALISLLQLDGSPGITELVQINMPTSNFKPLTVNEIQNMVKASPLYGKYENKKFSYEDKNPTYNIEEGKGFNLGRWFVRSMGNQVGREVIRGIFNTFFRGIRSGTGR